VGTVVRATVKGNLLVAVLQGALGGLAFWVLDLRGALLWAAAMALLSLLPAVGAALVWGLVAAWLMASGRWGAGLALLAWGTLVIGLVDNLLRPLLVGKDTRLPDWVVLLATLGGMAVFGLNGFVLGPVIVAMFLAVWQLLLPQWRAPLRPGAASAGGRSRPSAADSPADRQRPSAAGEEQRQLVDAQQQGAAQQVGDEVAPVLADADAHPRAQAGPGQGDEQGAGIAAAEIDPAGEQQADGGSPQADGHDGGGSEFGKGRSAQGNAEKRHGGRRSVKTLKS
jgi:hypothetical protein